MRKRKNKKYWLVYGYYDGKEFISGVTDSYDIGSMYDYTFFKAGNYFKTKKEALKASKTLYKKFKKYYEEH